MVKMKPPRVLEQAAPVLTEELLRRLLATCAGRDFEARRDTPSSGCCWTAAAAARRSPACGWAM
jgi:hypothetical protein